MKLNELISIDHFNDIPAVVNLLSFSDEMDGVYVLVEKLLYYCELKQLIESKIIKIDQNFIKTNKLKPICSMILRNEPMLFEGDVVSWSKDEKFDSYEFFIKKREVNLSFFNEHAEDFAKNYLKYWYEWYDRNLTPRRHQAVLDDVSLSLMYEILEKVCQPDNLREISNQELINNAKKAKHYLDKYLKTKDVMFLVEGFEA